MNDIRLPHAEEGAGKLSKKECVAAFLDLPEVHRASCEERPMLWKEMLERFLRQKRITRTQYHTWRTPECCFATRGRYLAHWEVEREGEELHRRFMRALRLHSARPHLLSTRAPKAIAKLLGFHLRFGVRWSASAAPHMHRSEKQVRALIETGFTTAAPMVWHEVSHALVDMLFYRCLARDSGFNWTVGYHPTDEFRPAYFRLCDGLPFLVRQSEELTVATHRALLELLGYFNVAWGSMVRRHVPSTSSLRVPSSAEDLLTLKEAIVAALEYLGGNPVERAPHCASPEVLRARTWFLDSYGVHPGQVSQLRAFLQGEAPTDLHEKYLNQEVKTYYHLR